jgi:hypothetical protein
MMITNDPLDQPSSPPPPQSSETDEHRERRMSIKSIMADEKLTPKERRLSIQALMDGRRRSSVTARKSSSTGMAAAAAIAALELNGSLSEEEDVDDADGPCRRKHSGVVSDSADSTFVSSGMSVDSNNTMMLTGCKSEGTPDTASLLYQQSVAVLAATAYYEGQNSLKTLQFSKQLENQRPICHHYQRNCTIIAACCGMAFGCRLCHDECEVLPPPIFDMQKEREGKHTEQQGISNSTSYVRDFLVAVMEQMMSKLILWAHF